MTHVKTEDNLISQEQMSKDRDKADHDAYMPKAEKTPVAVTIAQAIHAALEDWRGASDFDINDQVEWLEEHISDLIEEWCGNNGYTFDEEECRWKKPFVHPPVEGSGIRDVEAGASKVADHVDGYDRDDVGRTQIIEPGTSESGP